MTNSDHTPPHSPITSAAESVTKTYCTLPSVVRARRTACQAASPLQFARFAKFAYRPIPHAHTRPRALTGTFPCPMSRTPELRSHRIVSRYGQRLGADRDRVVQPRDFARENTSHPPAARSQMPSPSSTRAPGACAVFPLACRTRGKWEHWERAGASRRRALREPMAGGARRVLGACPCRDQWERTPVLRSRPVDSRCTSWNWCSFRGQRTEGR